jgi:hypothetical protein
MTSAARGQHVGKNRGGLHNDPAKLTGWRARAFNPDWRWLVGRDDSPWHRSVKLYRQPAIGDWNGVFTRVAADLRRIVSRE